MMSTSNKICNDSASKSNNDGVCEVNSMLHNMSTDDDKNNNEPLDICANCGKGGTNLNICNRCKMVKYCNAACKKKHRSKHKKKCDRRVAELHDEALFKQPPTNEDCPICFLRLPSLHSGTIYESCCGKVICAGCFCANALRDDNKKQLCAFCRTPAAGTDEEIMKRLRRRVEVGDAEAISQYGDYYAEGAHGLSQDYGKALKLRHQAAELGNGVAYVAIGFAYAFGNGVEVDGKKARHYYELGAMKGHLLARISLGNMEERSGNTDRAIKHFNIAAENGSDVSLKRIQQLYSNGHATKEHYTAALQAYQTYLNEIKSSQRDKAAAFDESNKYY